MTWSLEGEPIRSVLVTRLRYLGDIAMATVLLGVLRRGDPALRIGFLCESAYAGRLAGHPELERVHALDVRRRSADGRARRSPFAGDVGGDAGGGQDGRRDGGGAWGVVRGLRARRYDVAVDLFFNPRSALLVRATGARWRLGGGRGWRRRLYTHAALPPTEAERPLFRDLAPGGLGDHLARLAPLRHGAQERPFLDWFEAAYADAPPAPRVSAPALGSGAAVAALRGIGVDPERGFLLLAPGATWPFKEWPAERWRELSPWLARRQPLPLAVLAPTLRRELYAGLAAAVPAGRGGSLPPLPLGQALRAVAAATALVTVDGGIMHAAVAMRRPTLALFGPTEPEIWFPYTRLGPYRVLCRRPPCHPCDVHDCERFECLPALTAPEVGEATLALLGESGSAP